MLSADSKISRLYDNYSDSHYVATSQKEVEQWRRKASNVGFGVSVGVFAVNELARMSMRTRKSPQQFCCNLFSQRSSFCDLRTCCSG